MSLLTGRVGGFPFIPVVVAAVVMWKGWKTALNIPHRLPGSADQLPWNFGFTVTALLTLPDVWIALRSDLYHFMGVPSKIIRRLTDRLRSWKIDLV